MTTRWSDVRRSKVPDEAAAQSSGRALREALALSEIRAARGITQVVMARALETTQGSVSALEHRQDVFLSSLRDYIEALGGELEITAVFDDERIPVAIGEPATA
jgi:transcriptional regulator with XRE-family HTH domain